MAKTPSSNVQETKQQSEIEQEKRLGRISRSFARNRARRPARRSIGFANAPMASGSRRAGRMAENSRIGSAPTRSFSARLSNAACRRSRCARRRGRRSDPAISPMSGCRQPRRDVGTEAFSVSRPDLANGASLRGNAPRLARFRSDSAAAIWRRRLFRAMTAAPVVSLPLRTSALSPPFPATESMRPAASVPRSVRNKVSGGHRSKRDHKSQFGRI